MRLSLALLWTHYYAVPLYACRYAARQVKINDECAIVHVNRLDLFVDLFEPLKVRQLHVHLCVLSAGNMSLR